MDIPEGVNPESVDENGDWPWTLDDLMSLELPDPHDKETCPLCMMVRLKTRLASREAAQYVSDHHNLVYG